MTRALISQGPIPGKGPLGYLDMSTQLGDLELTGPVLTASGCAAAGRELDQFFDITQIGGIVTKSVMMQPRSGRPTPRMAETPSGMLNSIGLQGPGIDRFLETDLEWLNNRGATTVVSIAGSTVDEYGKLASRLRPAPGVAGIEVNISCPNVDNRGLVFACQAETAASVIQVVRRNSDPRMPIFAKLSPDVTDIVSIVEAVVRAGATGVSLINTLLGMVINPDTMRPHLAGQTGGLSGPAIRPVAIRCVWQVREAFPDLPIIGMGGIRSGIDALEFILAGANAVSVGTVVFHDPSSPLRIHEELQRALIERGFGSLSEAISFAHRAADAGPPEGEDGFDFITE